MGKKTTEKNSITINLPKPSEAVGVIITIEKIDSEGEVIISGGCHDEEESNGKD